MMTDMENEDNIGLEDDILLGDEDDMDLDSSLAEAMAEATAFLDSEESDDLDKTIQTMAATQLCVHPEHSHSFSKVTFTLGASLRKCGGCNQGFHVFGASADASAPADASIVKCMACGAVAHRSCAFSPDIKWEPCPVNAASVQEAAQSFVVTDDEEEGEFEMELNDSLKEKTENGDDESIKRKNSFLSANSSDESMATQDLDEGEEVAERMKLEDAANEDAERDCTTPTPGSPNGVARRTISNLLFPKRKEEGPENPDATDDKTEGVNTVSATVGDLGSHGDAEDAAPLTPTTGRKRIWFGNSPKNIMPKGKASIPDEESNHNPEENGNRARRWFSGRKNAKENQNSSNLGDDGSAVGEDDSVTNENCEAENSESAVDSLQQVSSDAPRAPWLSAGDANNGVQEDYGEDFSVNKSQAPTIDSNAPSETEESAENQPQTDANTAGRRGWFQRRQKGGEDAPEPPSNDPSPAPKPRGFGLFNRKRSQREIENANNKDDENAVATEDPAATAEDEEQQPEDDGGPASAEGEFYQFLDVMDEEEKEEAAETAKADWNEFLDVSDEEGDDDDKDVSQDPDPTNPSDCGDSNEDKKEMEKAAKADFNEFLDVSGDDSDNQAKMEDDENDVHQEQDAATSMECGDSNEESKQSETADVENQGNNTSDGIKESSKELENEGHAPDETSENKNEVDDTQEEESKKEENGSKMDSQDEKSEESKTMEPAAEDANNSPETQDEVAKESKAPEPVPEEKKGLLGFGLFRRRKAAEDNPEDQAKGSETNGIGGAENTESGEDCDTKAEVPEAEQSQAEECIKDPPADQDSAGDDNPSTPVAGQKPRFRLFSRFVDESGSKVETADAEPVSDAQENTPQASPRPRLINALWRKNASGAQSANESASESVDEGDGCEIATAAEGDTILIVEESSDDVEGGESQSKPSLFTRVFTPSKIKAEDEDYVNLGQAGDGGDEEKAAEEEETTPRRFGLFSSKKVADVNGSDPKEEKGDDKAENMDGSEKAQPRKFSLFGFRRSGKEDQDDTNQQSQSWASDEPPSHWATATTATFQSGEDSDEKEEGQAEQNSEPLHYANHPFASVSRALQENIMAMLSNSEDKSEDEVEADEKVDSDSSEPHVKAKSSLSMIVSPDPPDPPEVDDTALGEIKPEPVQESTLLKVATGTYEAVKATAMAQKKMGMASVAGGIAGGVAGLMFAGPAGAVMGVRYGQTAGALGVVLEGSLTVGVIVAGVAGGSFTADKIQEQIEEQRVLTIGGHGVTRKVMLVRPTICIDPVWHSICAEAQRTSPSSSASAFSLFSGTDTLKQDRYERTSDICEEEDIPTEEKVLLLVSRVLSDKDSFPGHVYRCLMQSFKNRCKQRNELRDELAKRKEEDGQSEESAPTAVTLGDADISLSPRARREDAHGVIKYITGTLLEVRPGLASTPEITETTASVVEALVFGEVYDLVYEEIAIEATEKDKNLIEKIDDFEYSRLERTGKPLPIEGIVSKEAIDPLRRLPETHAAVDKLRLCVVFLEKLSDHFASTVSDTAMGADSLLKMVCQHIIAARMPCVNAEVAFLEEFARDEQLLRGKEGYALVTLQAALHFLNMSNDFERDIFGQDNEEENVPLVEPTANAEDHSSDTTTPASEEKHDQEEQPLACMPPNTESGSDQDAPDLEHASVASSSDEKVVSEVEAREEKKEDATSS